MKDKITIGYILVTVLLFVITLVYFADLDFKKMNDDIENGGKDAYSQGKHYSDKLYTMVSKKWEVINKDDNDTKDLAGTIVISKEKQKITFGTKGNPSIAKGKSDTPISDNKFSVKKKKVPKVTPDNEIEAIPIIIKDKEEVDEINSSIIIKRANKLSFNTKKDQK